MGQSCGWLIIMSSIMRARNLTASSSSMTMRVPSCASVMQAMAISLFSSPSRPVQNWRTAHCRQAPIEPMTGCQQKNGRSKPSESATSSMLRPASTRNSRPSITTVTRSGPASLCRAPALTARLLGRGPSCRDLGICRRLFRRCVRPLVVHVGAPAFLDVLGEVVAEQPQRRLERLHRARREVAERLVGAHDPDVLLEHVEILRAPTPLLDVAEQRDRPLQSLAAGRAPAARLLGEELQQVEGHADWAGLVVQQDERARAQAAERLLH